MKSQIIEIMKEHAENESTLYDSGLEKAAEEIHKLYEDRHFIITEDVNISFEFENESAKQNFKKQLSNILDDNPPKKEE